MRNLKKNYFLLGVLFVVTILVVLYVNSIIREYKYYKVNISPLQNTISQINIDELDIALSELNNGIIYVGNTHSKENKRLERDLLKKIKSENLENYIYYCDITSEIENDKYINSLINKLPSLKNNITTSPALIYFKNNEAVEVIDSSERKLSLNDLMYLVQKYEIAN